MHLLIGSCPYLELYLCSRTDIELKNPSEADVLGRNILGSLAVSKTERSRGNFYESVYKTETHRSNLSPIFRRIVISSQYLCANDYDRPILFRVWDESRDGSDNLCMGECQATLRELILPLSRNSLSYQEAVKVPLLRSELKAKRGYTNSGFLVFTSLVRYRKIDRIPGASHAASNISTTSSGNANDTVASRNEKRSKKSRAGRNTMMGWKKEDLKELKDNSEKTDADGGTESTKKKKHRDDRERSTKKKKKEKRRSRRGGDSSVDLTAGGMSSAAEESELEADNDAATGVASSAVTATAAQRDGLPSLHSDSHHFLSVITLSVRNLPKPAWYSFGDPNPFVTVYAKASIVEAWKARQEDGEILPKVVPSAVENSSDSMAKESDTWIPLLTSEIKHNSLNPDYDPFVLDCSALSNGDWDASFQLSISYSSNPDKIAKPSTVGSTILSLREFLTGSADPDDSTTGGIIPSDSVEMLSLTHNTNQKQLAFARSLSKLSRTSMDLAADDKERERALKVAKRRSLQVASPNKAKVVRPEIPIFKTATDTQPSGQVVIKSVVLLESMNGPKPAPVTADLNTALQSFTANRTASSQSKESMPPPVIQPNTDLTRQTSLKHFSTLSANYAGHTIFVGSSATNGGDSGNNSRRSSREVKELTAYLNTVAAPAAAPIGETVASRKASRRRTGSAHK